VSEEDRSLSCHFSENVRAQHVSLRTLLTSGARKVVTRRKSSVWCSVHLISLAAVVSTCSGESDLGESGYAIEREVLFDFRPKRICFAFRDPAYDRSEEFCAEFADDRRELAEVSSYARRIAKGVMCSGALSVKCSLYLTMYEDSCPDSLAVTILTVEPDSLSEIDGICGNEPLEIAMPAKGTRRGEAEGRE